MRLYKKKILLGITIFILISNVTLANVIKEKLENGITLILNEERVFPIIAITVFFKTGSLYETEKNNGITNLTFELLLKGTKNFNSDKFAEEIESIGALIDVDTTSDYTTVSLVCIKKYINKALELLVDAIKNPSFSEDEIDKQKKVIISNIESRDDNVFEFALKNFKELMYEGHPYRFDSLGEVTSILNIKRQDIVDYYKKCLSADKIVISVSGDFLKEDIIILKKKFEDINFSNDNTSLNINDIKLNSNKEKVIIKEKKQSIILLGFLAPSILDKDYPAFKVLNAIMGSGMSSKLFNNLREKEGLAYEIGSFFPSRINKSSFVFYAGTRKENIDKAKEGILNEIKKGIEITEDDLQKAKNYIIGNFYLDHQTNIRKSWYYGWYELLGKGYEYDKEYIEDVKKVRVSDINRIINEYFKNYALLVVENSN
jgi:predicted Zn-dependent peptidase